jgi:DNA-directed RNA polymerase subunit RPC12/RpoP
MLLEEAAGKGGDFPTGRCVRCGKPIDDHEQAQPCQAGKKKLQVKMWLKFENGICTRCSVPLDDHKFFAEGISCPR